jgi:hypothetical protein
MPGNVLLYPADQEGQPMKMFIWKSPYQVDYGAAVAVAIAETEEQARELLKTAEISPFGMNPIMPSGARHYEPGMDVKGPATRAYDLPCAEFFQWSE